MKKQVIHFDAFFLRISEVLQIESQQELAKALGVNRSAITQAKNRNTVPESWITKLARENNLSLHWLSSGAGEPFIEGKPDLGGYIHVPKVRARLCAGGGSFEVDAAIEDFYAFKSEWLRRKGTPEHMVLMDVFGNSMEPLIQEGDMALIDQQQKDIFAGSVYAVGIEDTVMLKRIEKRPGAVVLRSDNLDYSPLTLQGEELEQIRIIGKMIWSCREYR